MARDERWGARASSSGEVTLERDHECPACCKRRRERCGVCGGTGTWRQEFVIHAEAAEALASALGAALRRESGGG